MKRRVRPAFYRDIAEQELWLLENAGSDIADRWHEALWKAIDFLEAQPFIGRERHDLKHRVFAHGESNTSSDGSSSMVCGTTPLYFIV